MRIVHTYATGRQAAFGLTRIRLADGAPRFLTGAGGGEASRRANGLPWPYDMEAGPNVIVEAAFRVEPDCLIDAATGFRYLTDNAEATHGLLHALAAGVLRIEGGLLKGFFTFKKCRRGGVIALIPHGGRLPTTRAPKAAKKAAFDDTLGAPDLSDFIKTLGAGA